MQKTPCAIWYSLPVRHMVYTSCKKYKKYRSRRNITPRFLVKMEKEAFSINHQRFRHYKRKNESVNVHQNGRTASRSDR